MDGLDLSAGEGLVGLVQRRLGQGGELGRPTRRPRRRLLTPFRLLVLLPTLLSGIYFFGFAAPQYVSEAQFVVRGQGTAPPGMLTSLLATAGGSSSASEDTYAVQDYMMSRDAASELLRRDDLGAVFARPEADRLARFPGMFRRHDFEHFFWYYQNHVVADLDTTTGISTLTVRTFRPADSERIATALLAAGERLVNQMNARQRENTIRSSQGEVDDAEAKLRRIGDAIASYRNREALLDPMRQSVPMLKDISDLETMLTTTRMEIAQLQASAPGSPLLPVYQRRAATLAAQIAQSDTGVTGSSRSLVPKITAYDDLTIQRDLVEKELVTDTAALDAAKTQADRQLLYLDEVVQPNLPDYAEYPRALADTAVIFLSLLGLYLMGRLLLAGAREHQIV